MAADGGIGRDEAATAEVAAKLTKKQKYPLVWDLPVRVFHWALVISFFGAYITHLAGVSYFKYHLWFGYAVISLVSFRILWGIVGTRHARFWNFVRGPASTWRYARDWLRGREGHYAGHNPLGALMVIVLLITLLIQAGTGLFGNDEIFNVGPLYGYISNELSLQLTTLHRQLFYWILGAVVVHILAVIAHLLIKRERLVRAMITGRKPHPHNGAADGIHSSRIWLATLLVIVVVGVLTSVVLHAPAPDLSY